MPSSTTKQAKFMMIAAHSPQFAKQAGVPQSVAQDFYTADKRSGMIARVAAERRKKAKKKGGDR